MKYRLLDLLVCPKCKDESYPLKIVVDKVEKKESSISYNKPLCSIYCGFLNRHISELKEKPPCEECLRYEIIAGRLVCSKCGREYLIRGGIPVFIKEK